MDFYLFGRQNAASHKLHFLLCLVKLSSSSSSSSSSDSSSSASDSEDEVSTKLPGCNMFCVLSEMLPLYWSQHAWDITVECVLRVLRELLHHGGNTWNFCFEHGRRNWRWVSILPCVPKSLKQWLVFNFIYSLLTWAANKVTLKGSCCSSLWNEEKQWGHTTHINPFYL